MNSMFVDVGEKNQIVKDEIVMVIDARTSQAKRIKDYLREKGPTFLVDLSGTRKALSLILLKGGRGVLSFNARTEIVRRCGAKDSHPIVAEPPKRKPGRPRKDEQTTGAGSTGATAG